MLRLVRVVDALLQVLGEEALPGADWVVVPDHAEPLQDLLHHLLAVDGVLERHAHVVVVERRHVRAHREGVVLGAGDRVHREPWAALEQVRGLEVHPVDGVDLAGDDGVGAGGGVDDGDHLDLVEVPAPRVPVVRILLQIDAHPGSKFLIRYAPAPAPDCQSALPPSLGMIGTW